MGNFAWTTSLRAGAYWRTWSRAAFNHSAEVVRAHTTILAHCRVDARSFKGVEEAQAVTFVLDLGNRVSTQ